MGEKDFTKVGITCSQFQTDMLLYFFTYKHIYIFFRLETPNDSGIIQQFSTFISVRHSRSEKCQFFSTIFFSYQREYKTLSFSSRRDENQLHISPHAEFCFAFLFLCSLSFYFTYLFRLVRKYEKRVEKNGIVPPTNLYTRPCHPWNFKVASSHERLVRLFCRIEREK